METKTEAPCVGCGVSFWRDLDDDETTYCPECWDALCEQSKRLHQHSQTVPVFLDIAKGFAAAHLARSPETKIDGYLPKVWAAAAAILAFPETNLPARPVSAAGRAL